MKEVELLIYTAVSYFAGLGFGYFACLYRNQHILMVGRRAITDSQET